VNAAVTRCTGHLVARLRSRGLGARLQSGRGLGARLKSGRTPHAELIGWCDRLPEALACRQGVPQRIEEGPKRGRVHVPVGGRRCGEHMHAEEGPKRGRVHVPVGARRCGEHMHARQVISGNQRPRACTHERGARVDDGGGGARAKRPVAIAQATHADRVVRSTLGACPQGLKARKRRRPQRPWRGIVLRSRRCASVERAAAAVEQGTSIGGADRAAPPCLPGPRQSKAQVARPTPDAEGEAVGNQALSHQSLKDGRRARRGEHSVDARIQSRVGLTGAAVNSPVLL
jgi:hypothetical protein